MNDNKLTESQLEEFKSALIELDDYDFDDAGATRLIGEDWSEFSERVVLTHEIIDDFSRHSGRCSQRTDRAIKLEGYQYDKGDQRVDLYIVDLGDVRAVVEL